MEKSVVFGDGGRMGGHGIVAGDEGDSKTEYGGKEIHSSDGSGVFAV